MLKVAIIGSGQVARTSHINHYQSLPGVQVLAVCDTNLETAKEMALEFGIPHFYGDHIQMLKEIKPDAVSVCVPNKYHKAITCDALALGAHVLCEKPPALTADAAGEMEETAKRHNKILTFGFHFRHSSNVEFAKNIIGEGKLGTIYRTQVKWLRKRGIPGWGSFTNKEIQGGGPLIDIGVHMLDLALYLLNYPKINYVCASASDRIGKQGGNGFFGSWDKNKFTVEDSIFGMVVFEDGTSLNMETSFAIHIKEKESRNVELFGDQMGITLFPLECFGEENGKQYSKQYPHEEAKDWHYDCVKNFVEGCTGEAQVLVTPKQAVYIQKLVSAFYQSAEIRRPVYF